MTTSSSRVLTLPNAITAVRIIGIPVLLVLVAHPDWQWPALIGLAVLAATDWVDGALARKLGQVSELGRILDPVADHLLVHASGFALALVGYVPWWIPVGFAIGDAIFLVCFAVKSTTMIRLRVLWPARARAVCVGAGFPLALLADLLASGPIRIVALILLSAGLLFQASALAAYINLSRIERPVDVATSVRIAPERVGNSDRS
jgi:cardiolipin synthase